jgi:hypothetical protein
MSPQVSLQSPARKGFDVALEPGSASEAGNDPVPKFDVGAELARTVGLHGYRERDSRACFPALRPRTPTQLMKVTKAGPSVQPDRNQEERSGQQAGKHSRCHSQDVRIVQGAVPNSTRR